MAWLSGHLDVGEVQASVRAAIGWWLNELRAMIPEPVLKLVSKPRTTLLIDLKDGEAVLHMRGRDGTLDIGQLTRDQLEQPQPPRSIVERLRRVSDTLDGAVICLPPEKILRRVVLLPFAAARRLRPILAHEIERQTPLDAEQVYFDSRVLARDKETRTLTVELVMVKRDIAERAQAIALWLGTMPTGIANLGDRTGTQPYALLPDQSVSRRNRLQRWLTPALGCLAILLAIAALIIWVLQQQQATESLAQEVRRLRGETQTVAQLRQDIAAAKERLGFLSRLKERPQLLPLLNEVTHLLPDGTWLFALEVDGAEGRIRGYSPEASKLITAFDASPLFAKAQFKAPLTQTGGSGLERFDLSFEMKGAAQP